VSLGELLLAIFYYFHVALLNSLIKNLLITKSMDESCDLFKGQATRPYRSIGVHLVLINWRVTSSDASLPTLPKMALAAL